MANTNQSDINKAAKKILQGMERIERFINNYRPMISDKDIEDMQNKIKTISNELQKK